MTKNNSESNQVAVGINRERTCTDIFFLILFAVFCLILVALAIAGGVRGDLRRLVYPTNSVGKICGVDNGKNFNYKNRPYLLFYDFYTCLQIGKKVIKTGCPTKQVCVQKCPDKHMVINFTSYSYFIKQNYCVNVTKNETYDNIKSYKKCPDYIIPSKEIFYRCIPELLLGASSDKKILQFGHFIDIKDVEKVSKNANVLKSMQSMALLTLMDIYSSRYEILICCIFSIVISFLFILSLNFFVKPLTLIALGCLILTLGIGACCFFARYNTLKKAGGDAWPSAISYNFKSYGSFYNLNLLIGCILLFLFLVVLLITFGIYKNLKIAIELLKETSRAIRYVWGIYIYEIFNILLLLGFTITCITICALIQTMGDPKYVHLKKTNESIIDALPCSPNNSTTLGDVCNFLKYGAVTNRNALYGFVIFMWFWIIQFIDGINTCVVAGSFAGYYWALNKPKDIPIAPTIAGFKVTLRYHLGSVAFGSLLIAIFKYARLMFEYFSHMTNKYDNFIMKSLKKMLSCCFWCFEKFLNLLTENAFIYMIIHGGNFFSSTINVFSLMLKNVVCKSVTYLLAKVIVFLFVVASTSVTAIIAFFWFVEGSKFSFIEKHDLNYTLVPVIVVIILSMLINRALFEVYSAGVNTIFICFLEDFNANDGSSEKPYYMTNKLLKIAGKTNSYNKSSEK